jgi:hypothetical protein
MRTTLALIALAAMLVLAAPAAAKVKKLEASMSGGNEMPAGDPDGSGTAKLSFNVAKKKVCFTIRVKNLDAVQAAHIHVGNKSVASGNVVVPLFVTPQSGSKFTGCTKHVAKKLMRKILKHPRGYYVNVHTTAYGAGAIRGQLHKP